MKKTVNIVATVFVIVVFIAIAAYYQNRNTNNKILDKNDKTNSDIVTSDAGNIDSTKTLLIRKTVVIDTAVGATINTSNVSVNSVISFAKTLIGTPYRYASANRDSGFDCSGFITYVFTHFNIAVPRSSVDFTNVGTEVSLADSHEGDLILFTGTDSTEKFVGHMGIITRDGGLQFIHSSSGKANGVVITPMNDYYKSRFVKVVRIFPFR